MTVKPKLIYVPSNESTEILDTIYDYIFSLILIDDITYQYWWINYETCRNLCPSKHRPTRKRRDDLTLSEEEEWILDSDIGSFGIYEGLTVPLDLPIEEEGVELNSPKRGGKKKFYVYVKNDKGNVIKVQFGDTSGLKAKINNPEARKSFAARHKCAEKKDKTKPGYWACRLPHFSKQLGLTGGGKFFW